MRISGKSVVAAAAASLALSTPAPAAPQAMRLADGRTVSVTVPDPCRMEADDAGGVMSCDYKAPDGDFRNVIVSARALPLPRFLSVFSLEAAEFRTAPEAYMGAILQAMERLATSEPPGPGQRLLRAEAQIAPAVPGMDVCLRFDFDYSGPLGPAGDMRSDNGGLRCLSYDARRDAVTYIFLECMNTHDDLRRRDPAHDRETRRISDSLRVQG